MQIIKTMAVLLVTGLTLMPATWHGMAGFVNSQAELDENRKLTPWPDWEDAGRSPDKYFRKVDSYLNDHFGGRSKAIVTSSLIKRILNDPSAKAVRGRTEGWLFNGNYKAWRSYMGQYRFGDQDVEQWMESLERLKIYVEAQGAVFAAIIPPSKNRIYSEHVAERYGTLSGPRFREHLHTVSEAKNLSLIDIEPDLYKAKSGGPVYYKTDTHWTDYGAYQAYIAVMEDFNKAGAEYPILASEDLVPSDMTSYSGDLARLLGLRGIAKEAITDFTAPDLDVPYVQTHAGGENAAIDDLHARTWTNPNGGGATLLIIGDSFAESLLPFFIHSFDRVIYVHHKNGDFEVNNLASYKPGAVLFEAVEFNAEQMRVFAQ